jgi:hypothetical protein
MALSLEAAAGPLSSYHLDPRLGGMATSGGGWLTLTAAGGDASSYNSSPFEVLQQQILLEADRVRLVSFTCGGCFFLFLFVS